MDTKKLNEIHDLQKKMGNSVAICKEVLACMVEIYSLNHESAKSKDPSIALANIFRANERIVKDIPGINDPNNKGKITKGNKINVKIDINGMDVALLCEILGVFPDSMIEKPEHREKHAQQKKQKVPGARGRPRRIFCCSLLHHKKVVFFFRLK